jgi:cytoplasmic iron level regulating protein YaaA (DUF328/UPF0246 family)
MSHEHHSVNNKNTVPEFVDLANLLASELKKYKLEELKKLMQISDKLSDLTYKNYQDFIIDGNVNKNASPAIYGFKGDVYESFNINSFSSTDLIYIQDNLRIISGLYGILRPLDLIQVYRLEMTMKLSIKVNNLYQFWHNHLTKNLNELLSQKNNSNLINLASGEYFKVIDKAELQANIITPIFKENIKGTSDYNIVSIYSKKARGAMAQYILKNRIETINDIKEFSGLGYKISKKYSNYNNFVFIR